MIRLLEGLGRAVDRAARLGLLLVAVGVATGALLWRLSPFPVEALDRFAESPRVFDRDGGLLLQVVGSDGQWRLPVPLVRMGRWLPAATIAVEDRRFRDHAGVDPLAVLRAIAQDTARMRTVSGASTLTMQVVRMCEGRPRTLLAKAADAFRALQLEALLSKDEILETYLNLAPYGGNLRGVEAASRAWFGKGAEDLGLAEAALLAGLPQSPTALRPDRHPEAALARRRTVLDRLCEGGWIDAVTRDRAAAEPLRLVQARQAPRASHAAWWALARRPEGGRTTIDPLLQDAVERAAADHAATLPAGTEVSVVVIDVATSRIVALVGSPDPDEPLEGRVNGATAWRSPGSALKPFLYGAAMEDGRLTADTLLDDVPIHRDGWEPSNFDATFSGPVTAAEALRRSLNVPAIRVTEGVGLARCASVLRGVGLYFRAPPERRSGLSLAVGGAEVRLVDLVNAYATLARGGLRSRACLFTDEAPETERALAPQVCATLDDVLSSRRRAPAGLEALPERSVPWFAWKTGTSSGRRDAWAVGHDRRAAVGVWVGDFTGRGRPEFVGARAAEPLLARLFLLLPRAEDPPAPPPLVVRRPLPALAELSEAAPRILSPSEGSVWLAVGSTAVVPVRTSGGPGFSWFLDGRLVEESAELDVGPGAHDLRCADARGRAYAVRFTVR